MQLVKLLQRVFRIIVLILDGNSEIGAFFDQCKPLVRSRAATNKVFFSEKTVFLHEAAIYTQLPFNVSTMISHICPPMHFYVPF